MISIRRVESLLACVASLSVALAIGVAVWLRVVGPSPTGEPRPSVPWQVVRGEHAAYSVPPEAAGWTVGGPREVIYYTDADGEPLVGVTTPAAYDDGYCPGAGEASNRGFVGFAPAAGRPGLRTESRRLVQLFARGIGGTASSRAAPGSDDAHGGTGSVRASVTIRLHDPSACRPSRVGLDVVSFVSGRTTVSLVLVRDLGKQQLPDAVVEQILGSLRPATST